MTVNNLLVREVDWTCVKEFLAWTVYTESGTVACPEQTLLNLLAIQRHIGRKYLELLIGKLYSMHLTVPGVVAYLYHILRALTQLGEYRAWLLP